MKNFLVKIGLPALTLLTFFIFLGNRPLNEPDEGRYTEIAREMIETGNWLVPHFWYMPHLDKPPMTYWLVAVSMKVFGQSEWAARLPVALAGIGGVWAAYLLGCAMAGRRAGIWSALILQSAVFYFIMARMLTTDMLLTCCNAWAMYFLWRSWRALREPVSGEKADSGPGKPMVSFFLWHLAGWVMVALGFLAKGPIALAIPAIALAVLVVFRRREIPGIWYAGLFAGIVVFFALAAPWFLIVFRRVPDSAHYMILGQAAGHLLGTTIKNRKGFPGYYFPVLAGELLPWTLLLGWLWRRAHWRGLDARAKEGWLLLNVWAIFTFTLFSFSHAELPAYVLPIFPALAVMLAWRFFGSPDVTGGASIASAGETAVPLMVWRIGLAISVLLPAICPFVVRFIFHDPPPVWLICQAPAAVAILITVFLLSRKWERSKVAGVTVGLALAGFYMTIAEVPLFPINLKANQTLDQIGLAIRKHFEPGDTIVCWGRLPQGLPFYTAGLISETQRPYFGHMDLTQVPFEFPGNRERLGRLYLPDDQALDDLLHEKHGDLVLGFGGAVADFEKTHGDVALHPISQSGKWTLYEHR